MAIVETIIGRVVAWLDTIIPDAKVRNTARRELARLAGPQDLEILKAQLAAIVAEAGTSDPWTRRERPAFLYVMYGLVLWALPIGLIAAVQLEMATAIRTGMTAYLNALQKPLYALFGTG